ncbi:DNA polymerase III subunit delta [Rickettsiales endosymbiont of Paramecium tredecaurelia]|uniref:hypothetical protein n=1 Tax=Candidatus Sarmatiella mevalonica TaxID=2770581 RepID=UPI0019221AAC|nr:hypothetical protein [Candidatus Sarmatiella mevalonica]MBL3284736.1 DNA polymerase III subunit delta [Candidatus Sarmatiella mevalonica]
MIRYDVRHFNKLLCAINSGGVRCLLLYGNDFSYMTLLCKHLALQLNLSTQVYSYKEFSSLCLIQLLNNSDISGERKLIQIRDSQDLKQYLKALHDVHSEHMVVFWDGLYDKKNQLLFEKCGNEFAIVACYKDSVEDIKRIIFSKYQFGFSTEQLEYLTQRLCYKEHQQILNELDKLSLYQQSQASDYALQIEDIGQVIEKAVHAQGYEMCLAFALKQYPDFFNQIDMLKAKGIGDFLILRALINFYLSILQMRKYGVALDFTPPVPTYLRSKVVSIANTMSVRVAVRALSDLRLAERHLKRQAKSFNLASIIYK